MKPIDKDVIIAEIERLQNDIKATAINNRISKEQAEAYKVCVKLRSLVEDNIEVKKTGSEKELVEEIYSLIDNIKNGTNNNKKVFQKQYITKIFKVGKVKIGVIGLVTIKTPNKSTADFKNIKFLDYKQIIIEESRK